MIYSNFKRKKRSPKILYLSNMTLLINNDIQKHFSKNGLIFLDLCTPRSICWSTYQPVYWSICRLSHNWYLSWYIDRHATDMSVDISTNISVTCRSTYRLTYRSSVHRCVNWEWLSDCRPTCWSIGYRHSANTSLILWYLVDCGLRRRQFNLG